MSQTAKQCLEEFYDLKPGEIIKNPDVYLLITEKTRISRRAIKHIVETRKLDGLSKERIGYLFYMTPETIRYPEIDYENPNQKKYPGSKLLGKFDEASNQGILVIIDKGEHVKDIINIFGRKAKKYFKLIKKIMV
ncbi:MAG: hypothetical protein A3I29_00480 [Candidatus Magasanikbacteria bacterium RIFCSPLOWO2_02_FULL_44_11]|uniref:Uncharacterized protein n=2 Tax=Candidatus Magasanikiibacteriota TaxID=1752731 RepID=A0A1F6N946_9BACT|nr:MAG: hypothetical protein A3D53_01680 [Candidatus Magasanikbacteria bacterium RIFCSPHIGHO2_02_FULL_45_10]OGH80381.1 MAG: hypothetical protein A3I29_00480 [Candidatus Magasanikbacteria bacterium RIFCSPLOWO2_02_FULL_44_11]